MKGINRDNRPAKLNDEYLHWAKNVVFTENFASITNEKGSILHTDLGKDIIGIIPISDKAIVFSVPGEIGVMSTTGYTAVNDPFNISSELNFSTNHPIVGTYQFNNKGECIIAFTDNFNKPKVANIGLLDNPEYTRTNDIKDILMFPEGTPAEFTVNILDTGGNLLSGVYNISYAYRNQDVTTPYFQLSAPLSITDDASTSSFYDGVLLNIPTAKAIEVNFTNLDISYEKLVVSVVYRVGTGTLASEVQEYTITGSTLTAIINQLGQTAIGEALLPEEVTVPRVIYNKVNTLTRLNDRLYIANLEVENDIDYQFQANNIVLNWTLDRTVNILDQEEKALLSNGYNVGYMPGEVYSFYIRLWFNDGSYSRAFHIPGRTEVPGDKDLVALTGFGNIETYKLLDTVEVHPLSNMGFWENENELYPTDFPVISGENVRHHRFPTLQYLKSKYAGITFGTNYLPVLGVEVSNVIDLPANCTHWELLYARRTYGNSTHIGSALGIHNAYAEVDGNIDTTRLWTSGGNWNLQYVGGATGVIPNNDEFIVNDGVVNTYSYLRLNSPDFIHGKPVIPKGSTFIRPEYKLQTTGTSTNSASEDRKIVVSDYTGGTSTSVPLNTVPILLDNYEYLNTNSIGTEPLYYNVLGEYTLQVEANSNVNFGDTTIGTDTLLTNDGNTPTFTEKAYLFSLVRITTDCYNAFYLQDTLQTGKLIISSSPTGVFLSGDCYIVDYSYISYGKNFPVQTTQDGGTLGGIRAIHRYITITPFNFNLRYITNQPYSKYYPKLSAADILGNLLEYDSTIEPNQYAYNREWSFVEVNKPSVIYNPDDDIITSFPLRIARSQLFNPEEQFNNWKIWLANDYYEHTERGRGDIINIEAYNNNLLIHQERGLYITTERTQLGTTNADVVLGTGDLFEVIPKELIPTESGYCGTLHKLACNLNKLGYCFIDALQGKVFIFNDTLNEISNKGLRNFFRDNLVHRETIIEQTTRIISATYNATLGITTIPKFQIEYGLEGIIYYDIVPPLGYLYNEDFYYITGNDAGNKTLNVLKRFNRKVYNDNPFLGNGFSITWDEEYSRLMLNKTKDCNTEILTRQQVLTRSRWLNIASRGTDLQIINETAFSGNEEIVEISVPLNPEGGILFFDFGAINIPDKAEIVWNGIVVAYTSMLNATPSIDGSYYPSPDGNSGNFPYRTSAGYPVGKEPINLGSGVNTFNHQVTSPAYSQWFIGSGRVTGGGYLPEFSSIPSRVAEFEDDTGFNIPLTSGRQQRVWFKYSAEDVQKSSNAIIRVTGIDNIANSVGSTVWNINVFSTPLYNNEYYTGTNWIKSYTSWYTTNEVTVVDGTEDTLSSTQQFEYFNGTNYVVFTPIDPLNPNNSAPTYTQWFDGTNWVNYPITYLDCGAAFILEGQIQGYYPVYTPVTGDIVLQNIGTEEVPVYEYKEWNGTTLINPTLRDEFLLSYSPANDLWVSSHSYRVNYLFSTYTKYYSLWNDEIYLMNSNERTKYYYKQTLYTDSAFIDVIFNTQQKVLFSHVLWSSEVFDENDAHKYNETVNKIRVYSNTQTTPLITLNANNVRRVYDKWSFNGLRDDNRYNKRFNLPVIQNLELIQSEIKNKLAHKRGRFITDWIVVRLEINNRNQVIIHSVEPVIKPVFR